MSSLRRGRTDNQTRVVAQLDLCAERECRPRLALALDRARVQPRDARGWSVRRLAYAREGRSRELTIEDA